MLVSVEAQKALLLEVKSIPEGFWDAERQELYRLVLPEYVRTVLQGAEISLLDLSIGVDWSLINQDAVLQASQYSYDLVTLLTDSTRQGLQDALSQWLQSGEPLDSLISNLGPLFGRGRAEAIAVTEVTRAYANANELAWKASGVVTSSKWQTAQDEIVKGCPYCAPMHDQIKPDLDGAFTTGVGTQVSRPPAHVNCRCIVLPVVDAHLEEQYFMRDFSSSEMADRFSPWAENLTPGEISSLKDYAGRYFRGLNDRLRGGTPFGDWPARFQSVYTQMMSAIQKSPGLPENGMLGRILYNHRAMWDAAKSGALKVGDTIVEKGFVSTSIHPGYRVPSGRPVGDVVYRIQAPKGSRGAFIGMRSFNPRHVTEGEYILPPGSRFRLKGISFQGDEVLLDLILLGGF